MKKIEFIAPVEAMRGKLSGNQTLLYAENDNPAFESPKGQRNYARNYRPSFIGAKVSSTGKVYFSVKTKSAVHMTNKAIQAMALQGATGAIVGALLAAKTAQPYLTANAAYMLARLKNQRLTFRKYVSDKVRAAVAAKAANINWTELTVSVSFKNPWYDGTMTSGAEVSNDVLAKFWSVLSKSGITFTVDGKLGIANKADGVITAQLFGDIIESAHMNVIPLSRGEGAYEDNVLANGRYVKLGANYIESGDTPVDGGEYITTDVAPEP